MEGEEDLSIVSGKIHLCIQDPRKVDLGSGLGVVEFVRCGDGNWDGVGMCNEEEETIVEESLRCEYSPRLKDQVGG